MVIKDDLRIYLNGTTDILNSKKELRYVPFYKLYAYQN
jgi:hypothetical protein